MGNNDTALIIGAMALGGYFLIKSQDKVVQTVGDVGKGLGDVAGGLGTGVSGLGSGIADTAGGIGEGVSGLGTGVATAATGLGQGISDIGTSLGTGVKSIVGGITSPFELMEQGVGALSNLWNRDNQRKEQAVSPQATKIDPKILAAAMKPQNQSLAAQLVSARYFNVPLDTSGNTALGLDVPPRSIMTASQKQINAAKKQQEKKKKSSRNSSRSTVGLKAGTYKGPTGKSFKVSKVTYKPGHRLYRG